jgi:hypothetical protein
MAYESLQRGRDGFDSIVGVCRHVLLFLLENHTSSMKYQKATGAVPGIGQHVRSYRCYDVCICI